MKHTSYILLLTFCIAASATLCSCDKVPINGDLDGMWQIMTIQTPDGTRNVKSNRAYLSFQLHLSEWDCGNKYYFAHFRHSGDSIFFYDFMHNSLHRSKADDNERMTSDEMTKEKLLDAWGVHNLDARYHVQRLNSDELILERADTVLFFRKF